MINNFTPIIAIATASGRGGIGVVRLSGKNLGKILQVICEKKLECLVPRYATYLPFKHADGSIIDYGIVIYFKAPHSYTGEDILEFQGHGGYVVMQMLLARCLEVGRDIGMRLATPGEFTQRAFLNDKLDLAQAEAVSDLINASTEAAVKSASASLSGTFSKIIFNLIKKITNLRALIEANINFPEETFDSFKQFNIYSQLNIIRTTLNEILIHASQSTILRNGLNIILVGQPNVGKSLLLNVLTGHEVAIVTPIAGTTRDKIIQTIQIEGVLLNIIDTAGIRKIDENKEESNFVEKIGIERTWTEIKKADIILYILDAQQNLTVTDKIIIEKFPKNIPIIYIWNKIDQSGHKPKINKILNNTHIYLSALNQQGINFLHMTLLNVAGLHQTVESPYLARTRHIIALKQTKLYLDKAAQYTSSVTHQLNNKSLDLFAEELRLAQEELNNIIGKSTTDDLLGIIFSQFCIGK